MRSALGWRGRTRLLLLLVDGHVDARAAVRQRRGGLLLLGAGARRRMDLAGGRGRQRSSASFGSSSVLEEAAAEAVVIFGPAFLGDACRWPPDGSRAPLLAGAHPLHGRADAPRRPCEWRRSASRRRAGRPPRSRAAGAGAAADPFRGASRSRSRVGTRRTTTKRILVCQGAPCPVCAFRERGERAAAGRTGNGAAADRRPSEGRERPGAARVPARGTPASRILLGKALASGRRVMGASFISEATAADCSARPQPAPTDPDGLGRRRGARRRIAACCPFGTAGGRPGLRLLIPCDPGRAGARRADPCWAWPQAARATRRRAGSKTATGVRR